MARRTLALLALALLGPARPRADEVTGRASLHLLYTGTRNLPGEEVLFDRTAKTFLLEDYLVPAGEQHYGSMLASVGLDGRHLGGDLRWSVTVDTGELRRQALPALAPVCLTQLLRPGPTGLDVSGSGSCRVGSPIFQLPETVNGSPQVTSNGRAFSEELEKTLLVREAYVAWSFGRAAFATVRAGRKRTVVADGYVYDDYATGLEAVADLGALGPPFELAAGVYDPSRDFPSSGSEVSPMVVVRASWIPTLFEHADLFAAYLRDRGGGMGEVLQGAVVERLVAALDPLAQSTPAYRTTARSLARALGLPFTSDAVLGWLGTSGSLTPWRGERILWTGALLGGRVNRVDLATASDAGVTLAEDLSLSGKLASLRLESDLGSRVVAGAWFLWISGGGFPSNPAGKPFQTLHGSYGAFLGVSPYLTATNLFFGGGLSETYATRQVTAEGVNGRGVLAPGLSLDVRAAEDLTVSAKGAYLRADVPGPFGGRTYGTEVDLDLTWSPADWITVGGELDALWPGDFFGGQSTVYKGVLALDLRTP